MDTVPLCNLFFIVVLLFVQTIISIFYFSMEELSDSDFNPGDCGKEVYDRFHDRPLLLRRAFWSGSAVCMTIYGILAYQIIFSVSLGSGAIYDIIVHILVFLLGLIIYLSVSVFTPYHLSDKHPKKTFVRLYRGFSIISCIIFVIAYLADLFSVGLSMLFGEDPRPATEDVTEEDVISMVGEAQEQGNILASEAEMIQNIFEFDEKDAKDIMINRTSIIAIDGESTFHDTLLSFNENKVSRMPVYHEDLDDILGIVHMKEVLKYSDRPEFYEKKLTELPELMRSAEFVPETHGINTLFTQMQLKKSHMVIVVDEYGQTSGIVTMEDILEEIVGNIQDEHDEEEQSVRKVRPDTFLMQGQTSLSEVSETLSEDFSSEEFETLNGFLTDQIGRVPDDHEHFSVETRGFRFDVLDVKNRIIQDVRVQKCSEPETAAAE